MSHTFHWDFFGPYAERTAAHFLEHTEEFLKKNDVPILQLVLESEVGRSIVSCRVGSEHEESVAQALRPRRITGDTIPASEGSKS